MKCKMKTNLCQAWAGAFLRYGTGLLFGMALVAGCATDEERSRSEFAARMARYPAIPADDHDRLQRGEVRPGDTREVVWVARGEPSRKSNRVVAGQTNEVWSYVQTLRTMDPAARGYATWQPVVLPGGRMMWTRDPAWFPGERVRDVEILRVEFATNRVVAVEAPRPSSPPQP